jgi:hypothetical protein
MDLRDVDYAFNNSSLHTRTILRSCYWVCLYEGLFLRMSFAVSIDRMNHFESDCIDARYESRCGDGYTWKLLSKLRDCT